LGAIYWGKIFDGIGDEKERKASLKGAARETTPYRSYGGWNMGGDH